MSVQYLNLIIAIRHSDEVVIAIAIHVSPEHIMPGLLCGRDVDLVPGPSVALAIHILIPRDGSLVKQCKTCGCDVNITIAIQIPSPDRESKPLVVVFPCNWNLYKVALAISTIPVDFASLALSREILTLCVCSTRNIQMPILVDVCDYKTVGASSLVVDNNLVKAHFAIVFVPRHPAVILGCYHQIHVPILIDVSCHDCTNTPGFGVNDVLHFAEDSSTQVFIPCHCVVARRGGQDV
mmetsp:Transcript_116412/g.201103  ORF Transcript_116412/g.201103 Transcript_116412/m.201103 type:complete len:237 (+) Transcript_116412:423-1133(+)